MESIGLVLEGGGMRGVYTAGVLEYFSEQGVYFPYTIGVSAGACMAASYLSRQQGRNRTVNVEWVKDSRYISWGNLLKKGQLFGMDFVFDEIPNKLVPFDYKALEASTEEFVIGTTDCRTGETVYYKKSEPDFDVLHILRASSSLPFIAPIVEHAGRQLLDGGISDPIPLRKSQQDGNKRNVLVLTRNREYRKSPNRFAFAIRRAYGKYPAFVDRMLKRHETYNSTLAYIDEQESKGTTFVIRPQEPLVVGRMERDSKKLDALYRQGYEDAKRLLPSLQAWMAQEQ
ncbi:putative patatin/cPLA2 family phospholipase [Paenibacillus phyllosphaerae]|uniref:Putative patatin/cPLA2 family phospholipase n=1 Tax=Paenibacillus phyllosphaerae TaxID=274593 RepID=A0A7W5B2N0_9BACL|nr:patatin family protein [Paenibacillus phyllosphaerae]MBB3113213.1 putative patatin/cPLA2 family phospholipase [Paenibacillus phyllosphaerae]